MDIFWTYMYTLFDLEYLPVCLYFLALRDQFVHSRHNYTKTFYGLKYLLMHLMSYS